MCYLRSDGRYCADTERRGQPAGGEVLKLADTDARVDGVARARPGPTGAVGSAPPVVGGGEGAGGGDGEGGGQLDGGAAEAGDPVVGDAAVGDDAVLRRSEVEGGAVVADVGEEVGGLELEGAAAEVDAPTVGGLVGVEDRVGHGQAAAAARNVDPAAAAVGGVALQERSGDDHGAPEGVDGPAFVAVVADQNAVAQRNRAEKGGDAAIPVGIDLQIRQVQVAVAGLDAPAGVGGDLRGGDVQRWGMEGDQRAPPGCRQARCR